MSLSSQQNELISLSKRGVDFISSATIIWSMVVLIGSLETSLYNRNTLVFIVTGLMLPLAFGFSKLYNTQWNIEGNELQKLGLWLNIAQLFYFPILIIAFIKVPEHFISCFAIITGAHFFPYSWLYKTRAYAIAASVISVGSALILFAVKHHHFIATALFMSVCLLILAFSLFEVNRREK